jgi:hypothetical protein
MMAAIGATVAVGGVFFFNSGIFIVLVFVVVALILILNGVIGYLFI